MKKILSYFRNIGWKRAVVMSLGNIILTLGVALFRFAGMGNDPYTGMTFALSDLLGIYFPWMLILENALEFVLQLIFGRSLIGIGTVFNAVLNGYLVSFYVSCLNTAFGAPGGFVCALLCVILGVVICAFGLSLYQEADVGVSPYDALALMLDRALPKIPYFWCRVFCDGACAVLCLIFGGIVGLGTVVTCFGLGPVIQFFNRVFTDKYIFPERK